MQHYDIAAELAATRVKRGLTLFDISHKTKIQVEHLQKLESGCYDFLPRFYVRQIVRMYAEALGLPADTINLYLRELDSQQPLNGNADLQSSDHTKKTSSLLSEVQLGQLAKIFSPMRLALVIGTLLSIAVSVSIYLKIVPNDVEVVRRTGSSASTSSKLESAPESAKPDVKHQPTALIPTIDAVSSITSSAATVPNGASSPAATANRRKLTLIVRAKSDCWVGVVADEHKVQEAYLRANESSRFEADSLVKLTIGKAEVAEVWLNGKSIELPKRAGVVSNLRFSLKDVLEMSQ